MKSRNKSVSFISIILFLLLFSGIIREDVDESAYLELAKQPQFECVGQIFINDVPAGSCVIIDRNFVVTAAHVVMNFNQIADTVRKGEKTQTFYTWHNYGFHTAEDVKIKLGEKMLSIKKITIHPEFLKNVEKMDCDLALLELENPVSDIQFPVLNSVDDELLSDVTGVGFGVSGKANDPSGVSPQNKKIAGENVIDRISGFKSEGRKTLLLCDFDSPTNKKCNKMGSAVPLALEYICSGGDSGGGLFRFKNNRWELIGICSGGSTDIKQLMKTGYYGQIMEWTRVSAFEKWLNSNLQ